MLLCSFQSRHFAPAERLRNYAQLLQCLLSVSKSNKLRHDIQAMTAALTAPTWIAAAITKPSVFRNVFHTTVCHNTDFILIHLHNEKVSGAFKYLEKPWIFLNYLMHYYLLKFAVNPCPFEVRISFYEMLDSLLLHQTIKKGAYIIHFSKPNTIQTL